MVEKEIESQQTALCGVYQEIGRLPLRYAGGKRAAELYSILRCCISRRSSGCTDEYFGGIGGNIRITVVKREDYIVQG